MTNAFPLRRLGALLLTAALLAGCDATDPVSDDSQAVLAPEAPAGAPDASASPGAVPQGQPFRCDQTNPVRPEYYESVTGRIVDGVPVNVLVFRKYFPDRQDSFRHRAGKMPADYWPVDPGYQAWNVTGHPPGEPTNDYVLVIPKALPPSGPFSGELHVWFNHGQYGWWQTLQGCTFL